jgi:CBS domain-containing protein
VHRLAVLDGDGQVCGMLEALDLFSFLANHSHLILVQIEQARDLQALEQPAAQITQLLSALHRGGTRIALMAQLVQQLNARLFERAWQMLAPADLVANSCLFVMGSEGRGEQLLKTDQDNGLVLRDGYAPPADLDAICQPFRPRCSVSATRNARAHHAEQPGMARQRQRLWPACHGMAADAQCRQPDAAGHFLDAHAVAGDAALLAGVRQQLQVWPRTTMPCLPALRR